MFSRRSQWIDCKMLRNGGRTNMHNSQHKVSFLVGCHRDRTLISDLVRVHASELGSAALRELKTADGRDVISINWHVETAADVSMLGVMAISTLYFLWKCVAFAVVRFTHYLPQYYMAGCSSAGRTPGWPLVNETHYCIEEKDKPNMTSGC